MIQWQSRVLVVGTTGSGKSVLVRQLARSAARHGMVVVIDPAGSATTELPGAVTFHDPFTRTNPHGRDWTSARVARFVPPDPTDEACYDQLYRVLWSLRDEAGAPRPVWVWLDEAGIPMPSSGGGKASRRFLVQGRKRELGHAANHTRPVDLDRYLKSQAAWFVVFYLPDADDRAHLAKHMGVKVAEFEALHTQLEAAHAQLVAAGAQPGGSIPHGFIVKGPGIPPVLCAPLDLT